MGRPKVMVAVRDAESVECLVTLACQLAQIMEADLKVLHVVVVPALTPLEALDDAIDHAGKAVIAKAQRVAAKFSRPISTELLRAREASEAIVGTAKDQAADLLVMGHHKPHPLSVSETLLGSIVNFVAHHAPCRVIVQVPAPEHK